MKIKEQIEGQRALIKKLEDHQAKNNDLLLHTENDMEIATVMLRQLLNFQTMDLDFKIAQQKHKLSELEKYYNGEYQQKFEKESRECNLNMQMCIEKGAKVDSPAIRDILTKYELEKETISQEDKNDLYTSLRALIKLARK